MTQNKASMTKDNIGLIYINGLGFYIHAFGIDDNLFRSKPSIPLATLIR